MEEVVLVETPFVVHLRRGDDHAEGERGDGAVLVHRDDAHAPAACRRLARPFGRVAFADVLPHQLIEMLEALPVAVGRTLAADLRTAAAQRRTGAFVGS